MLLLYEHVYRQNFGLVRIQCFCVGVVIKPVDEMEHSLEGKMCLFFKSCV